MESAGRSHEPIMVGPYRLIQRLGEGGMGVVHLALDQDGRAVAIKVLRPHIAADPDARRRLEREMATLRRVQHPRVAAVIDADIDGELPYLVTSFVPGKPLDTYIKEHGPLPRGHVARVGSVLADALTAIHAAGVVHRDVKPANVMMLDGEPILIDFGIAHVADETRITHTGLVMGTPGYLSPEIIGGDPVTPATDWWGWGATLAFAATGRAPFGTGPIEVVLDRVRRGLSDLEGMDEGLKHTLTRALSVNPDSRPLPDVLVAGLAAVPPARPKTGSVINVNAPVAAYGAQDRTVPRPPPGAPAVPTWTPPPPAAPRDTSDQDTVQLPPPDEAGMHPGMQGGMQAEMQAGMRYGSEDRTERLPPINGFDDRAPAPAHTPEPAYAGRSAAPPAPASPANRADEPGDVAGRVGGQAQKEAEPSRWAAALHQPIDSATAGRGIVLGVLVVLSLIAAVAPQSAICIVWGLLAVMRVVDHANTALLLRRQQFGQRGSDAVMIGLSLPWRALVSVLSSLFLLVLPVLIGISVIFIAAATLAGGTDQAIPAKPASLAIGMAAILLSVWFGPGGGAVRRGTRLVLRGAITSRRAQLIAWSILGLFVIAAVMVISRQQSPDWGTWGGTWLVRQLSK